MQNPQGDKSMRTIALAVLLVLFASTAQAKIYRWVDKNGSVHFSDKPYSEDAQEIKINETGIELDEASVDEEQEQPATTPLSQKNLYSNLPARTIQPGKILLKKSNRKTRSLPRTITRSQPLSASSARTLSVFPVESVQGQNVMTCL